MAADANSLVHDMLITTATAMAAGAFLITIARSLKTSAIGLLIVGAFLLGPEYLGILKPESLGEGLKVIVSIAIGVILFEGGLTLDFKNYKKASTVIRNLLSYGVLITWFGSAALIYVLFQFPIPYCLLFGSLIIVTGPTVIAPLLRRIRLAPKLHTVLHWEGVLIDPIGVFIALLCYEYVVILGDGGTGIAALNTLLLRVVFGIVTGVVCGYLLVWILKKKLIPREMTNVFSLGFAIMTFGIADYYYPESGLLSVTIAGFITGLKKPVEFESIKTFKAELTDLLIGMLFMLLASRLKIEQFTEFGAKGYLLVALVMLLIRPLSIMVCSLGSDLNLKEKLFLGWVAPRGIVAASFASIVSLNLSKTGAIDNPAFAETFVYSIIIGTIVFQEFTAGFYARILGIQQPVATGWLIVGAHRLARHVAHFLNKAGVGPVMLVDQNQRAVEEARSENLNAMTFDARDPKIIEDIPELTNVGHVISLTDNESLNVVICDRWSKVIPEGKSWFWGTTRMAEGKHSKIGKPIWGDLPKPTLLSQEIQTGETLITVTDEPVKVRDGRSSRLLAAGISKSVLIDPTVDQLNDNEDTKFYFTVRRQAESLLKAISPHLVLMKDVADQDELFRNLVELASKVNPVELPVEELVTALHKREKSAPTAVGHGVAIPHVTSELVDHRICAVAKVPQSIQWETIDKEPVTLVFLILSPSGDPEGHLAMLAEIARLVSNEDLRQALREAEDPNRIVEILQQRYISTHS